MSSAELLARMNPTACRFDIGRGGISELANIDVAGALGMVKDQLGRAILQVLYCDGDMMLEGLRQAERLVYEEVMPHIRDQKEAMVEAEMRELVAESAEDCANARRITDRLRAVSFPDERERILAILRGVLLEMRHPNHCPECNGRGQFVHNKLVVKCPPCKGTGRAAHSERKRADWCGMSVSGFRSRKVQNLHKWLWERISPAHHDALRSLSGFLRSEDLPTLPDNPHVVVEFVGEWE